MIKSSLSAALLFLALPLAGVHAQDTVVIQKNASGKISLDWSGFKSGSDAGARSFYKTLTQDLIRSGHFLSGRPGASQYVVSGSVSGSGASLKTRIELTNPGTRSRVFGQQYTGESRRARRLAHQVADDIVEKLTGRPGIASTRIAVIGTRNGHKELFVCDADGGGLQQITRDRSISMGPVWGPKARKLVYTSYLKKHPDVYLIDVMSGARQRVASYPGMNSGASISPDGGTLALVLSKDGRPELYLKSLAGERLTRLTQTDMSPKAGPTWSPDGKQLAFVSGHSGRPHLYRISRSGGGGMHRLTKRGSENVSPDWGSNGWITYSTRQGSRYQIAVLDPNTLKNDIISPNDGADWEDPSWAPDGRHIVCTRTVNYRSSVYILDTKKDPPIALLEGPGDWFTPDWSP